MDRWTRLCKLREIMKLPYGKNRRTEIIDWCKQQNDISCCPDDVLYGFKVNTIDYPIIKRDPDLYYLIKKGILKQQNTRAMVSIFTGNCISYNYLVLNEDYR